MISAGTPNRTYERGLFQPLLPILPVPVVGTFQE
jgi:hypothetical protein